MRARRLAVDGAVEFVPDVFRDERGHVLSPFRAPEFRAAVGHPLFPVRQTGFSTSHRGVIRGPHFTAVPPGTAKYVYAPLGRILDFVIDVRVGSPTFGRWDSVLLDERDARALYLPVGVAHMFVALADGAMMSYLLSTGYDAEHEHALSAFDPELNLPIPDGITPVLSERDRQAPTLRQAAAVGLLPDYARCLEVETGFADRPDLDAA